MKAPSQKLPWKEITRELSFEVELVTPQFGGGSQARSVDLGQWLRPSAVRGALRFWWRGLATSNDIKALAASEASLFGSATRAGGFGPGRVSTVVQCKPLSDKDLEDCSFEQGNALNGAYFPASLPTARLLWPGATAQISIRASGIDSDTWDTVCNAIAAFVVFGGSGARTRRAAGAIVFRTENDAAKLGVPWERPEFERWIMRFATQAKVDLDMFSLSRTDAVYLTRSSSPKGIQAQTEILSAWREIRQDRDHPWGWKGASQWGRTRWPEADARRLIRKTFAVWADGTTHEPSARNGGRAPRSHLGLPIGFKFKDDQLPGHTHPTRGALKSPEPPRTELVPVAGVDRDRYASPVLLAVARCKAGHIGVIWVTSSLLAASDSVRFLDSQQTLSPGPWSATRERLTNQLSKNDALKRLHPDRE